MAVSARGQITITDMRNEGTYTFLRYSDDGGQKFTLASQTAQEEMLAGMPLEGRNLWDCSLMRNWINSTIVNVVNANTNAFTMTVGQRLNFGRIQNIFRWANKSWGEKSYVVSGYIKADKPVNIRFKLNDTTPNESPFDLGTEYQFFSVSWNKLKSEYFEDNMYFGFLDLFVMSGLDGIVTFTFDKLKLEVGDKASAFTPTNLLMIEKAEKNTWENRNFILDSDFLTKVDNSQFASGFNLSVANKEALVGKALSFSYLLCRKGETEQGSGSLGNRFGMHGVVKYINNQTGDSYFAYPLTSFLEKDNDGSRVTQSYVIQPESGYEVDNIRIAVQPFAKPAKGSNEVWLLGYPKLEIGDTATPWSPAPEDGTLGTTQGKYLGTLVWDKPYPSNDPKDYVWARIEGENGADAEKYELSVVEESALIERTRTSSTPLAYSDKLTISLKYNIMHVKGDTSTVVPASDTGYYIRVRGNNGKPEQTKFSAGNTPTYALTINNYSGLSPTQKSTQIIVELLYKNAVIEKRLVPVLLKADSWLEQDAQHIALINRQAQQIASVILNANGITQRLESLRNGVRNLTRGRFDITWSSGAAMSNFIPVTLEPSTTYTITMCAEMSDALAVRQGAVIQLSLSSGDNAFSVKLNLRGKGKQKVWTTFDTGKVAGFPADGKVYYRVYMGGGDGVSTATLYWVTLTPGTIPAEDYYEDVQTMITDGRVVINGETRIDGMLFTEKAKVGGGVFYDKYIYSAQGSGTKARESDAYKYFNRNNPYNDQQWRPKMVIDTETGEAMFADGNVRLRPDGSGYLAGKKIQWDIYGNVEVIGIIKPSLMCGEVISINNFPVSDDKRIIDFSLYPATTYIHDSFGFNAILPGKDSNIKDVEITVLFPNVSTDAKLSCDNTAEFYLFIGRQIYRFDSIWGCGWLKLKMVEINNRIFWIIEGCGGSFTININGRNKIYNGVTLS
jgi:hypothetical protein